MLPYKNRTTNVHNLWLSGLNEPTLYQGVASHMMISESPGHRHAVMTRVLIIYITGAFLVGAQSAEQVCHGALPALQPFQETLQAWKVLREGYIMVSQGINLGEGEYC